MTRKNLSGHWDQKIKTETNSGKPEGMDTLDMNESSQFPNYKVIIHIELENYKSGKINRGS